MRPFEKAYHMTREVQYFTALFMRDYLPDQAMRQVRAANHFITAPIERMTTGTGVYTM
jgi:hypothetical protein